MIYEQSMQKLNALREQISELRGAMRAIQAQTEAREVPDYTFETAGETVQLSALFGDRDRLFVVHNMGSRCAWCTMWADGFNGLLEHLSDCAAFVVSSPDAPEKQAAFAAGRGWRFPMVSSGNNTFTADMGYKSEQGWMPGVSVFKREHGRILRVSDTSFGPGDDFCAVWHLLGLLPEGAGKWGPKLDYAVG